jgi:hypothetical protein
LHAQGAGGLCNSDTGRRYGTKAAQGCGCGERLSARQPESADALLVRHATSVASDGR